jgi:hypothetical protein
MDGANWIQLAQNSVRWWACVNTAMNVRVPEGSRIFLGFMAEDP